MATEIEDEIISVERNNGSIVFRVRYSTQDETVHSFSAATPKAQVKTELCDEVQRQKQFIQEKLDAVDTFSEWISHSIEDIT